MWFASSILIHTSLSPCPHNKQPPNIDNFLIRTAHVYPVSFFYATYDSTMSPSTSADPAFTLSTRGADLAAGPDVRENEEKLYGKPWDPVTNPDGVVNIGTAENVGNALVGSLKQTYRWNGHC